MNAKPPITQLLQAAASGDDAAQRQIYELAYAELRRIARASLRRSGGKQAINPTTLVHEAWMKIAQGAVGGISNSEHFYSLFARAMRQVLIDLVRKDGAVKHGGELLRAELDDGISDGARPLDELLQIDAALRQLELADAELAQLVEWHFFGGLSFVEIAAARGVTERTVRRHWSMARALLLDVMPEPSRQDSRE
jgi:RNA polymerase sigma factor (TIGR02999 family)